MHVETLVKRIRAGRKKTGKFELQQFQKRV